MSDVVAGVVWAAEAAATKARDEAAKKGSKHKGSVANMSLGGGNSPSLDQAVNACLYLLPAAAKKPITVGASTIQDDRAYFSNHGKFVDIFAPGLQHQVDLEHRQKLDLASLGVFEDEQDEFVAANGEAYDLGQYLFPGTLFLLKANLPSVNSKEVVGYGGATKSDDGVNSSRPRC
ncbi:hypothetical protein Pst134EB_012115 [Puccinia striiformis f. sp. tritici]|nr:hypothetical protein Pst134EB_012115 [Puccinia striiformis f. sp. tritici]